MGIDDRDYMKSREKDPGKDWYNPKSYRGGENGGYRPPYNPVQEDLPPCFVPEPVEERPWVRPWLLFLFLWLLAGIAIHKAIQFNQERIARKEQERQAAIWQEQQQQLEARQRAERAYRSPYAGHIPPTQEAYPGPRSVPIQAPTRPPSVIVRNGVAVLEASRDGHYFSSGTVNGFPVVFMVDTGATYVSIGEDTAARAGISRCTQTMFNTANGQAVGCKAIVPMIEFAGYAITNVEVAISKGIQGRSLLGMNVLRLFKMQQEGNQLSIKPAS